MDHDTLFISAGDPSGDIACGRLVCSLRTLKPDLQLVGLGGPRLKAQGQRQLAESDDLAVLGFWEVLKKFGYFRELMNRCVETIERERPSCIVLVDYPGFNLRLAERVNKFNIPIIYYISPQVWAWGHKRVAAIKRLIDLVIVILPFEEEFYRNNGVNVQFVGHYLLEDIPVSYISSPPSRQRKLALLPGSRPQEIERMLPVMIEAAGMFNRRHGTTATIAAMKNSFNYERWLRGADGSTRVAYDDSRKTIAESDLVLTASGTATLETGIIGRPMVIVYKTGRITYEIARRLIKIDRIGLVNLVLGERVVPELIQDEATAARLVMELERFWNDTVYYEQVRSRLNQLPSMLHGAGASDRAAKLISAYL